MAITSTLRAHDSSVDPAGPLARLRAWLKQRWRSRRQGHAIEVGLSPATHLESSMWRAAAPARHVLHDSQGVTLWIFVPGASKRNTEVLWDPEHRKLSVGVWSSSVDRARRVGAQFGPRLLWYTAFWLPQHDGKAVARLLRGKKLEARVPLAGLGTS